MSLVSTYVLADDGLYYKNPTIRGDDWFICFDDDDPPELVIEKRGRSIKQITPVIFDVLAGAGIDARPRSIVNAGGRCFGDGLRRREFRDAMRCWLSFKSPPPASLFVGMKGRKRDDLVCDCCIETCGGVVG